jgi:hypothetical protein
VSTRQNHGPFSTVKIFKFKILVPNGPWLSVASQRQASAGRRLDQLFYVWYVIVIEVLVPALLRFLARIVPAASWKAPVPPVTVP